MAIPAEDFFHVFFKNCEHRSIRDNGVLDDLGETAAEFAIGERAQQLGIG